MNNTYPTEFALSQNFMKNGRRIGLIGDSRVAQLYSDTLFNNKRANSFIERANCKLGQRMTIVKSWAISGKRSDEYITTAITTDALSQRLDFCIIWGCVNDISQSYPTATTSGATAASNVIALAQTLILNGVRPILITEPGSTSFAQTFVDQANIYNNKILQFCESNGAAVFFDIAPSILSDTNTTGVAFKTINGQSVTTDGTHYTNLGGDLQGDAFAEVMRPLIPPLPLAFSMASQSGTINAPLLNPMFTTQTGGISNTVTLASGTLPASWQTKTNGTISAVVSYAPNGQGNDITFKLTSTVAGSFYFEQVFTAITGMSLGLQFDGGMEYEVAGVIPGVYTLVITQAATNAGNFTLLSPTNEIVGVGVVGTAFNAGGISFTLADGATDFVAGDKFKITISNGAAIRQLPLVTNTGNGVMGAITITPGATNLVGVDCYLNSSTDILSVTCYSSNVNITGNGNMPEADRGTLRTPTLNMQTTGTLQYINLRAEVIFSGAGTATVTFRRPWVRRRI